MFFTQEDYKKIEEWLSRNAVRDTEFNEAVQPFEGNEIISFVQNGHNTKAYLKDFVNQLFLLGIPDFVNITEKFDESNISLSRAIQLIPYKSRKIGQVITFLNEEGVWKIYQFKGKEGNQWNEESLWVDLINDIASKIAILADEEDITTVEENGANVFKFKDRTYNPDNFSGKGYKILRKNIVDGKNVLTQEMINEANTVYEIRYDFDLNNETIAIQEGCTLKFEGGSLNNGTIIGNNTYVLLYSNCINVSSNGNFKNINNIVFSNVEELVSANNLLSGFKVSVLGYYEKEDGGDAQYIIKIKEESDIVDKGSIIELNNNLYAKIIPINGKVNLRQFGAKPCNYWSEYFDSTIFIQNAFNYVSKYSNSTYSNDLICKTIEVNGVFYTKELNIFGVNNNARIEIKGVGNGLSGFEYIGDNGYKIDKTSSNNNSYILKINNSNNSFIIRNISFKGLLNRSTNVQSVAAYGLYFDDLYDYGSIIENCSFSTFVKSGLYFKNGLNVYIKGVRFDICINSCIEAGRLTNFVLKDFTIDIAYHNFTYLNEDIKEFFYQFPHIGDSDIALGNSILYIHTGMSNSVINIEQARIEGGKFPYEENNPSSFIKIDKTNQYNFNYAGSFNLSNINFTVIPDYIVYCVDKLYSPIINFNNFNTVNRIAVINIDNYNLKSSIAPKNGIVFNDKHHNVDGSSLFINGKNIIISDEKNCPYFVKYKDIVLLEKYINTDSYQYRNFIGAVCTYPINGYGYAMRDSWYSNDFEITIDENKNIISNKQLYFNYNYTITYDDEFKEEIVVSDVIYDNNKYIGICNKYIPTRNNVSAKINYTKAKFRFFGNTTNDYLSGDTYRRNSIATEKSIGDFYFDTTLNKPIWWNGTNWVDKDGNNADFKSQGTFAKKPSNPPTGFAYFCTDKQTTEGTTNGIIIYHKGNNVWVDALGRVIS